MCVPGLVDGGPLFGILIPAIVMLAAGGLINLLWLGKGGTTEVLGAGDDGPGSVVLDVDSGSETWIHVPAAELAVFTCGMVIGMDIGIGGIVPMLLPRAGTTC